MTGGRFEKGRSGNPKGRPKKRRPDISAFDIIFDQWLTVTQNGATHQLTVEEALEVQTYQAALKGSRMAIRQILKMIQKREAALAAKNPAHTKTIDVKRQYSDGKARRAFALLDIAIPDPNWVSVPADKRRLMLKTWATQAGLDRLRGKELTLKDTSDIRFFTLDAEKLRWPRGLEQ